MKKLVYIISISIVMFYYFNPILENKTLVLSPALSIEKEPKNNYYLSDKKARYNAEIQKKKGLEKHLEYYLGFVYVDSLKKYRNIWIGYMGFEECQPGYPSRIVRAKEQDFPGHYIRDEYKSEYFSFRGPTDQYTCKWLIKEGKGYFYIKKNGDIRYKLTKDELEKELKIKNIKFKDPNYYIQKYGKDKDTNEIYFSRDSTESMRQITSEVKQRAYLIRNRLYLIFVLPSVIFIIKDLKRIWTKKNRK